MVYTYENNWMFKKNEEEMSEVSESADKCVYQQRSFPKISKFGIKVVGILIISG
jgi:hypothetical protein